MNEHNQHNLDQFFKKRLKDNTPADNGWNVPPMSILDNALEAIEPEITDRKPLILKSLLGLGLLALVVMIYLVSVQVQSLNDELSTLKQQHSKILTSQPAEKQAYSPITEVIDETTIDNKAVKVVNQRRASNNAKAKFQGTTEIQEGTTKPSIVKKSYAAAANTGKEVKIAENSTVVRFLDASRKGLTQRATAIHPNQTISQLPIVTKSTNTFNIEKLLPITLLPSQPSLLSYRGKELSIQDPVTNSTNNEGQFSFYVLSGLSFSNYQMSGAESLDYSLSQFQNYRPGFQTEVGFTAELSDRWNVFTSIEYAKWSNTSMFIQEVTYDEINMTIDQYGVRTYSDMIYVSTPSSTYQNFMEFQFRSDEMADGSAMLNKTIVDDKYQSIGLSLGLSYDIIQRSRFSLSALLGSTLRSTFTASQNLHTELYDGSLMMGDNHTEYSIQNQLTNQVVSATLGSQISYRLTSKIDLLINLDYSRDLSPINLQTASSTSQTYQNRFFFGTGLAYRL